MFNSKADALEFRDELVAVLGDIETDGWQISPRLDGAHLQLGGNAGEVRGVLDGQGFQTNPIEPTDGWSAALTVEP